MKAMLSVALTAALVALLGAARCWLIPAPARRFVTTPSGRPGTAEQPARVPDAVGAGGRQTAGTTAEADEAWAEVLAMSPDADTPGMRMQFLCHWQFADSRSPARPSWNLEPWRPVVDDADMVASGCNPGGPEEPF